MKHNNPMHQLKTISLEHPHCGWLPDIPDHRDFLYTVLPPAIKDIPSQIDLRPVCPPIENQGNLGSCSGNPLAGALEYLENKDHVPFKNLSRLFIYYNERALKGIIQSDSGAMIRGDQNIESARSLQ